VQLAPRLKQKKHVWKQHAKPVLHARQARQHPEAQLRGCEAQLALHVHTPVKVVQLPAPEAKVAEQEGRPGWPAQLAQHAQLLQMETKV
jgi:hypothetical protein